MRTKKKSVTIRMVTKRDRKTGEHRIQAQWPVKQPKPLSTNVYAIELVYKSAPKRAFFCIGMVPALYIMEVEAKVMAASLRETGGPIVNVIPVSVTQKIRKKWTRK